VSTLSGEVDFLPDARLTVDGDLPDASLLQSLKPGDLASIAWLADLEIDWDWVQAAMLGEIGNAVKNVEGHRSALLDPRSDTGKYAPKEITEKYGIENSEAFRKALDRWREANPHSDGWVEVTRSGKRSCKWLYMPAVVSEFIEEHRSK
ncbi:MAG TPA: hypothetical protein P5307_29440, partial [Pirellulaceae bacterium]|nr:hypothetical protein [Pirellulaceae bacterium]